MVNSVYGLAQGLDVPHWSQMADDMVTPRVASGLQVIAKTGRTVTVGAGRAWLAGASFYKDVSEDVVLAANTSGLPRIDTVCVQVIFTGTISTAGQIFVRQGIPKATPVAPSLTKTPGGTYQIPLANILVGNGVATITGGNITDVRPGITGGTFPLPAFGPNWDVDSAGYNLKLTQAESGLILLSGRTTRINSILASGDTAINGAVFISDPAWRPRHIVGIAGRAGASAVANHWLEIFPDGTATFTAGAQINVGNSLRLQTTPWIGA